MARTNGTTECDLIDYEDIEETIRKWIRRADTFATIGLFSQDPPMEGDRARRVWSTEFRQSRAQAAAPVPAQK